MGQNRLSFESMTPELSKLVQYYFFESNSCLRFIWLHLRYLVLDFQKCALLLSLGLSRSIYYTLPTPLCSTSKGKTKSQTALSFSPCQTTLKTSLILNLCTHPCHQYNENHSDGGQEYHESPSLHKLKIVVVKHMLVTMTMFH